MPKVKISDIKIEKRIREDYGNIEELAESIKQHGLLQPIIVTPDNNLIAGERRIMAAKLIGWNEIKCIVKAVDDRYEQLLCEIAENEKRKDFTPSERVGYGRELEVIERLRAKERQGERKDLTSSSIEEDVKNKKQIKSNDVVGKKIGMSGISYYRAKKIVESGNKDVIEQMDKREIGILTAYNKINKKEDKKVKKLPDKQETKEKGDIKKESPVLATDEKNSLPISLSHIELLVNNFLAVAERFSRMTLYIPELSIEEREAIIKEVHQIIDWHDEFVKLLKSLKS